MFFDISLTSFEVYSGNFTMAVVHNGQIVATLSPGGPLEYRPEDITGTVSLRIAGESASFSFDMFESDYDLHSHEE